VLAWQNLLAEFDIWVSEKFRPLLIVSMADLASPA